MRKELMGDAAVIARKAAILVRKEEEEELRKCQPLAASGVVSRKITIVCMSGPFLDLEMPCEALCLDVMREVKRQTNTPMREQKNMWGETRLTPRSKIPSDDVLLFWVRVKAVCGFCGQRQRRHNKGQLCSGCMDVTYCGSACQEADWGVHRALCRPCNS